MALQLTWTEAAEMSRQRTGTFAYHVVACLLFPLAASLGFELYITLFRPPLSRGVAIGLAVQLIFAAFVLANALIALTTSMKVKIVLTSALVIANLTYLLPQHPLRALFFAGLSGGLTLAAIYMTTRLTHERKPSDSQRIKD
jgi:predicted membrane-bound dolichyl-phosphate-mannose-protein mannosyltransferase